jgi:hypothetical protein
MLFRFGSRIRHPFFPGLQATSAAEAKARSAALYGTYEQLVRAADAGASVSRALFVLQPENEPLLSDAEREVLWNRFRAPVLMLLVDGRQHVIAYECEAQSGFHVNSRRLPAQEGAQVCECGRPGKSVCPAGSALAKYAAAGGR